MTVGPDPVRPAPGPLWPFAGAAAGWLDWVMASLADPGAVGDWSERLGTGLVAVVTWAVVAGLVAASAGIVFRARAARAWTLAAVIVSLLAVATLWHGGGVLTPTRAGLAWLGALPATLAVATWLAWLARRRGWRLPAVSPRWGVAGLVAALAVGSAVPGPGRPAVGRGDRVNVVLVSIDTLRADHLGCYGYARTTSPAIDAFAAGAVLFTDAYAQSNWTLPSHASMLTGLGPLAHGVLTSRAALDPAFTTLAERLQTAGYATEAFVGGGPYSHIGGERGFAQGFDHYRHAPHPRRFQAAFLNRLLASAVQRFVRNDVGEAEVTTAGALSWLEVRRAEPFFLFIHYFDVHSKFHDLPYEAPPPFFDRFCPGGLDGFAGDCGTGVFGSRLLRGVVSGRLPMPVPADLARVTCLYDGGVAYVDDQLGRLLAGLDRLGLADRTVVIVTADHGEALGDHGSLLHETVYDEVARVPLIIRVPDGVRGRRVAEVVGLVDLVPTVLELVGAAAAEVVEGESLAAELRGAAWPGGGTALTVGRGSPRLAGLRRERFKYVESREVGLRPHGGAVRREELYDLAADPVEAVDLVAEEARHGELADLRTRLAELKARAERIHQRHHQAGPADHEVAVPREEQERLRALGYVD